MTTKNNNKKIKVFETMRIIYFMFSLKTSDLNFYIMSEYIFISIF